MKKDNKVENENEVVEIIDDSEKVGFFEKVGAKIDHIDAKKALIGAGLAIGGIVGGFFLGRGAAEEDYDDNDVYEETEDSNDDVAE